MPDHTHKTGGQSPVDPSPEGRPLPAFPAEAAFENAAEATGAASAGEAENEPASSLEPRLPFARPPSAELTIRQGDLVLLLLEDGRRLTVQAGAGPGGRRLKGTHFGQVDLEALVGLKYGHSIRTSTDHVMYLIRPTLQDHIFSLKRSTQIIYPKDIGVILMKLGLREGSRVLECGTGSASLTASMAWMVGPRGHVFSYDREPLFQKNARVNLARMGLIDRVTLRLREIGAEPFDDDPIDAAFLDVREPPALLDAVGRVLPPGGVLGMLVPTTNQICAVLEALENRPYVDTEVLETSFRRYKVNASRLRPEDRMIGHTGYLLFTRRIEPDPDFTPVPRNKRARRIAAQRAAAAEGEPGSR